jgi:hypothetical protein
VARAIGVEGGAVQQGAQAFVFVLARQNIQLLVRAIPIAGKTEHLEQKGAALGIGGAVPQFRAQRLDGIVQFAGIEKFP